MFSIIKRKINQLRRSSINQRNKQRLTNHQFSVISSNCNGAFMLHDLGERFNSPFVNLYLTPKDFIRYLKRIEYYQKQEITFPKEKQKHYPVGQLDDITIYFMHYHSEQEAVKKWQDRTARMNLDNLFIIMTDRDGCDYQDLVEFEQLPFNNKVVFTHKPYPELKSAFYIQGFENQTQVGDLFEFSGWNGMKYYDQFDYVAWFNQGHKR
ncbi:MULTISPECIES: DUF1919 domain-containing protein [Glaesserella]|uniref:Exopolysaccharide biosynthesis protein n=1 Tax=Glaesserella australis TaxID=2094024 RepID=A0A328BZT9_9PAST|nr:MULTISPECIES: DUF1919 domain-containing protein [Glaesserella]AUI67158.1 exopolysaccharide biosynthesis protein [Glaesserella sp. 15-184]RAL19121.1 exopolysaccharide biosynthesis protein [Glaesserella australis]